jgi:hypothetical protein
MNIGKITGDSTRFIITIENANQREVMDITNFVVSKKTVDQKTGQPKKLYNTKSLLKAQKKGTQLTKKDWEPWTIEQARTVVKRTLEGASYYQLIALPELAGCSSNSIYGQRRAVITRNKKYMQVIVRDAAREAGII